MPSRKFAMTDPEIMLSAGKRLAAIAAGRAFKEDSAEERSKNREVKPSPAKGEFPAPATKPGRSSKPAG
jgi:hypothetical protein